MNDLSEQIKQKTLELMSFERGNAEEKLMRLIPVKQGGQIRGYERGSREQKCC